GADGGPREPHAVAQRAAARAGQELRRIDPGAEQFLEQRLALFHREGIGLAGGPERRQPGAALRQEPPAMTREAGRVGRQVRAERREDGSEHSAEARPISLPSLLTAL